MTEIPEHLLKRAQAAREKAAADAGAGASTTTTGAGASTTGTGASTTGVCSLADDASLFAFFCALRLACELICFYSACII